MDTWEYRSDPKRQSGGGCLRNVFPCHLLPSQQSILFDSHNVEVVHFILFFFLNYFFIPFSVTLNLLFFVLYFSFLKTETTLKSKGQYSLIMRVYLLVPMWTGTISIWTFWEYSTSSSPLFRSFLVFMYQFRKLECVIYKQLWVLVYFYFYIFTFFS